MLSAPGQAGQEVAAHAMRMSHQAADDGSKGFRSALTSLLDDLNTPQALAHLSEPLKALNDLLHTKKVSAAAAHWDNCLCAAHAGHALMNGHVWRRGRRRQGG